MADRKQLFMSYGDYERLAREGLRRPKRTNNSLAHIKLPSGTRLYPIAYIGLLMSTTLGQINVTLVEAFNISPRGARAIEAAKANFYARVHRLAIRQPYPGYLTVTAVAVATSTVDSTVRKWCHDGSLPWRTLDGQLHVSATDLKYRCLWHPV